MKQFDQYHRTLPISGRQRIIVLLDVDPENEYLLKVKYTDTQTESRLNKEELLKKWQKFKGQLQYKLFTFDRVEFFKRIYRQR